MPEEKLLTADALQKNVPRAVPPLAGFWFRLGALLVDVLLLHFVFRFTYNFLKTFYLSLGSASILFGLVVAFLYLFLAEGPVGKGVTVGKAVLGIRTADMEGRRPPLGAAAIRAALLLILALPFLSGTIVSALLAAGQTQTTVFLVQSLCNGLASAFVIANVFLVVLHPLKQTAADLVGRTIVLREAGAHNLTAYMDQVESQMPALQRRALQVAAIAFVALLVVTGYGKYRETFSEDRQRQNQFITEFRYRAFLPQGEALRAELGLVGKLLATEGYSTAPLFSRVSVPKGSSIDATSAVVFLFQCSSGLRSEDSGTSEELNGVLSRLASWTESRIKDNLAPLDLKSRTRSPFATAGNAGKPEAGESRSTFIFQPRCVVVLFVEEITVLFFGHARVMRAELSPLSLPADFYEKETKALGVEPSAISGAPPVTSGQPTTTSSRPTVIPTPPPATSGSAARKP